MAELWLLCEGTSDLPVLTAVLTRVLAAEISVKASGGSTNAPSAAAYVAYQDDGVTVAYVIDRDYRPRARADATFADGKPGFIWRRHAIESYLLVPAVIVGAFRSLQVSMSGNPGGGPAWVKTLPIVESVLADGLRSCAATRAPQEAARIAMSRLWEELSDTAGRIQKRVPPELGKASPDAAACRRALLDEAARIVQKAQETVASPHLTPASVGALYDAELARVSAPGYLASLEFIEEFHGKDLFSAFRDWLQREHRCNLKPETFLKELVTAVPDVYKANRSLYGTDDFLDLANGVRALAKLPPIA